MLRSLLKLCGWLSVPVLLHAGLLVLYGVLAPRVPIPDTQSKAVAGIILGNTVNPDGTVSKRLESRLQAGLALWENKSVERLVVSGAVGEEGVDEAEAMARWLVQAGVPSTQIGIDHGGVNTRATAERARQFLTGQEAVICISSYYHLARCHLAFSRAGLKVVGVAHGPWVGEVRELYAIFREVVAFQVYFWQ